MFRAIFILLGALFALSAPLAAQQLSPDWSRCANYRRAFSNDAIIAGCTAVLRSGRESTIRRAIAYHNRGSTYAQNCDAERAISDINEAIKLNPRLAVARYSRGIAYLCLGDTERALADLNQAIKLDPKNAAFIGGRGAVYYARNDHARAMVDFNEAIRINPKHAASYVWRGRAYLYGGSLARALADLKEANKLDRKDAYGALWLDLVERRSGLMSRLKNAVARLDMAKWPAAVLRLYLGEFTLEETLTAADHADAHTRIMQVCEATFFAGALRALEGGKDDAARMLRLAAADCPVGSIEWDAARAELRLLGVEP